MTTFTHYLGQNCGDLNCCPRQYFDKIAGPSKEIDILDFNDSTPLGRRVVIGGGGLLHPGSDSQMERIINRCDKSGVPVYVWGIGTNYHNETKGIWPDFLKRATRTYIRDMDAPYAFGPCPSCAHPAFASPDVPPTRDLVIYEHNWSPVPVDGDRMHNFSPDFERVVSFLRSGAVVMTNTFHGAYLALLLGRKVCLVPPLFSNRFYCALPKGIPVSVEASVAKRDGYMDVGFYARMIERTKLIAKIIFGKEP